MDLPNRFTLAFGVSLCLVPELEALDALDALSSSTTITVSARSFVLSENLKKSFEKIETKN